MNDKAAAGSIFAQGSLLSNAQNQIQFINATAGVHDFIFNDGLKFDALTNPLMMPPAAFLAIPAALGNNKINWITTIRFQGGKP